MYPGIFDVTSFFDVTEYLMHNDHDLNWPNNGVKLFTSH